MFVCLLYRSLHPVFGYGLHSEMLKVQLKLYHLDFSYLSLCNKWESLKSQFLTTAVLTEHDVIRIITIMIMMVIMMVMMMVMMMMMMMIIIIIIIIK